MLSSGLFHCKPKRFVLEAEWPVILPLRQRLKIQLIKSGESKSKYKSPVSLWSTILSLFKPIYLEYYNYIPFGIYFKIISINIVIITALHYFYHHQEYSFSLMIIIMNPLFHFCSIIINPNYGSEAKTNL